MRELAIGLMIFGAVLVVAGAVIWLGWKYNIPIGRLPGDFRWQGKNWSVYFPLATSIILSIILTILLNLFFRRR